MCVGSLFIAGRFVVEFVPAILDFIRQQVTIIQLRPLSDVFGNRADKGRCCTAPGHSHAEYRSL
jgi:hypothetical protein